MAKNYEGRKENGEGNVRKLPSGKYECVVQSKYINPKTGKPKRIKRVGETEKAAREKAKLDLVAWEKEIERGRDTKINKAKTFGEYMSEYIETEVKSNITGSGYHTYINNKLCEPEVIYPVKPGSYLRLAGNSCVFQLGVVNEEYRG